MSGPSSTNPHDGRLKRSLWKGPALVTGLVLLIPLLGNLLVDGWNWKPGGFAVLGVLIFGLGFSYQLVTRNVDSVKYRSALVISFVAGFVLTWSSFVQAADDVNPSALLYLVVPLVGFLCAVLARFRSNGMALALLATALAQAVVLVIVLLRSPPVSAWTAALARGFGGNAFLVLVFAGAALLFRKAWSEESVELAAWRATAMKGDPGAR